jgi:hypothetical protein
LSKNPAVAAFRAELKRPKVTLLYGAHDRANNHALVLADFLRRGTKRSRGGGKDMPAKKSVLKKKPAKKAVKNPAKKKAKPQAAARKRSR